MLRMWGIIFVALNVIDSGCFGLPYALPEEQDYPEQFMTGMTHPTMHDHTHEDHTGHEDHTDHEHEMPGGHGGMSMFFHASVHATILFEKWHTMNWWELLLSCIAIAVLACLYEGFKFLREFIATKMNKQTVMTVTPAKDGMGTGSTSMMIEEDVPASTGSMLGVSHLAQSGLHFVQLFLSYTLMLVFMTYNVYLCLALCLGGAVGYFLFGFTRTFKSDNEHCN